MPKPANLAEWAHLWAQKWTPRCRFDGNEIDRDRIRWLSPRIAFENVIIGEFDDFDGYTDPVYSRESAPPFFDTLRVPLGPRFTSIPFRRVARSWKYIFARSIERDYPSFERRYRLKIFITYNILLILIMSKVLEHWLPWRYLDSGFF